MGCRHHFVVDRLEDLVDEGGSRSSWRAHERSRTREFSACFTTECGNPDTLKSMSTSLNVVDEPIGLSTRNGSPRSIVIWIWVWLGWLGAFCLSSNFWTQFLHPVMFQGSLWRMTRWRIYLLIYDFSSFHPKSLRDTIGWECIVKDVGVRSRLIELQSFLLSKFDVDPIHSFLKVSSMLYACTVQDAVLPG